MSLKPRIVEFETKWLRIKEILDLLLSGQKVGKADWMDKFSDVYHLTIAKPTNLGEKLYFHVSDYLKNHVEIAQKKVEETSLDSFLETYHECWITYKKGVTTLNQLFSYLNSHIAKSSHIKDASFQSFAVEEFMQIEELGLHLWKQGMLSRHKQLLTHLIVSQIDIDRREGGQLKASMVREVVMSYVDVEKYSNHNLEYYSEWLESAMLRKTEEYYSAHAQDLIVNHSPFEYVEKTLKLLEEEALRAQKYLDVSTRSKVVLVLRQVMVLRHACFINRDIRTTIKNNDRDNLSKLYKLLQPISSGLKPLVQELGDHYYNLSKEIISNIQPNTANAPQDLVTGLLKTHSSGSDLISNVFKNDQNFKAALDKALNQSINDKKESSKLKPAELLVRYCDGLLRRTQKGDGETEDRLLDAITIFMYLDDKDFFNKFYSSLMAKRFIWSTTCSMEAEELMINKLKEICGYEFTTKLHCMFTDVGISEDLSNKYSAHVQEKVRKEDQPSTVASIMVLQTGAWPVDPSKSFTFNLPQDIEKNIFLFEAFYSERFKNRKLSWLHYLCQCELKLCYTQRPYFVTMGVPFSTLLFTLNSTHPSFKAPYHLFQENSGMTDAVLIKYLHILVTNKLLMHEQGEEAVTSESSFFINEAYSSKRSKVRINYFHKENTTQELDKVKTRLENDRLMYLEAVIVRVMKARKVLQHNSLIEEVIEQSKDRFRPSIQLIKRSVSSLLERSFIERTEEDKNAYKYVA